ALRALPPFPTRRSSDLDPLANILTVPSQAVGRIGKVERDPGRIGDREAARGRFNRVLQSQAYQHLAAALSDVEIFDAVLLRRGRSEEHTSELQSRFDLV